jgi:hypothetical protein
MGTLDRCRLLAAPAYASRTVTIAVRKFIAAESRSGRNTSDFEKSTLANGLLPDRSRTP